MCIIALNVSGTSIYDFHDADADQIICLDGNWTFYWKEFVTDAQSGIDEHTLKLPTYWNQSFDSNGHGTLHAKIILPNSSENFGLEIHDVHTAYRVIVGSDTLYTSGKVASSPDFHKPNRMPKVIPLGHYSMGDTLSLYIQMSNFSHHLGGVEGNIKLGVFADLQDNLFNRQALNLFVAGCYIVIGITLIVFYFMFNFQVNSTRGEIVYYGLFCVMIAQKIISTGSSPLHRLMPNIDYHLAMKMDHVFFYLAGFFGVNYLRHLFPKQVNKYIIDGFAGLSLITALVSALSTSEITMIASKIYLGLSLIITVHAIQVLYTAVKNKEKGANYLALACGVITLLTFINVAITFFGLQPMNVLETISFLAFCMLNNIALMDRYIWGYKSFHEKRLESNIAKNQKLLMSLVAHEIKTPLSQLKLNAEMLHLTAENSGIEKFKERLPKILERCDQSINNLNNMVTDLMHFVNQDSLKKNEYTVEFIADKIRKESSISVVGSTQFKDRLVTTNQTVMEYLIQTLVGNALKFTPAGNPPPTLLIEDNKNELILTVVDQGIGMNKKELETLGQPFIKMNIDKDGTGLGFYLSKNLLERLEHELVVVSEKDKGTRVSIILKTIKGIHKPVAKEVEKPTLVEKTLPQQADVIQ